MISALLLTACGQIATHPTPASKQEKAEVSLEVSQAQNIEKMFDQASKKLDALVDESIEAGPVAVQFLATDLYIKANDASIRGDAKTASFLYKYVSKLQPKDSYVKKKYAVELIRVGELAEARNHLEILFKKEHEEAIGLILGGVYTTLEKEEEAQVTYQQVLKYFPKSEEACVFLSKSYANQKRVKKAMEQLDNCQKKAPKNAIFSYYRGKISLINEDKDSARKFFEQATKVDPTFYQAFMGLGLLREEKEDFKGAAAIYKKFLKKEPANFIVLSRLVQVLFALSEFKQVLPYAEKLSSLDASDLNLKIRLGILYTDANRYDEAKSIFREILTVVPESDKITYYLGALNQQTGDFEQALELFSKVPSSSNLFFECNIQMANMLQASAQEAHFKGDQKTVDKFIQFIKQRVAEYPNMTTDLYFSLSSFYEGISKNDLAIDYLVKVEKNDNFSEGHKYFLASLYEKVGNSKKSIEIIQSVLEKNPNNAHALNFLGYALLERNDNLELAYQYINKAVALRPDDGYIRDSLGWYHYKKGNYNKALAEIRTAWESQKTDVVITKHLALVYLKLKFFKKAKSFFIEALKNCKLDSEKEEVVKAMQEMDGAEKLSGRRLPASK